jgi:hypothetical protein
VENLLMDVEVTGRGTGEREDNRFDYHSKEVLLEHGFTFRRQFRRFSSEEGLISDFRDL